MITEYNEAETLAAIDRMTPEDIRAFGKKLDAYFDTLDFSVSVGYFEWLTQLHKGKKT